MRDFQHLDLEVEVVLPALVGLDILAVSFDFLVQRDGFAVVIVEFALKFDTSPLDRLWRLLYLSSPTIKAS